jgi:hypothetical protein
VVKPARLIADRGPDGADELRVPGAGQPDGLREDRRRAEPREAVQGLRPGTERAHAQSGDRRLVLMQQRDLLVEREPGEQVLDPRAQRQRTVAEGPHAHGRPSLPRSAIVHRRG